MTAHPMMTKNSAHPFKGAHPVKGGNPFSAHPMAHPIAHPVSCAHP